MSRFIAALRRPMLLPSLAGALLGISANTITAQSTTSLSGFLSYYPSASTSSALGVGATFGAPPLAIRGSAAMSVDPDITSAREHHPWALDADLLLQPSFSRTRRFTGPYLFVGVGATAGDEGGTTVLRQSWSYGGGMNVALGNVLDIFGEARYRLAEMRLPAGGLGEGTPELRVGLGFHLGTAARTSSPTARRGTPSRGSPAIVLGGSAGAARVLPTADRYLGVPYKWGGSTPSGFDCSGFTQYVFARHDVRLPRTSREQAQVGTPLPADWRSLAPGDLVMFAEPGQPISHVAIYAGDDRIVHSSSSGGGVRYDDLRTRRGEWFVQNIVAARRVSPHGSGIVLDLAKNFSAIVKMFDAGDRAPRP